MILHNLTPQVSLAQAYQVLAKHAAEDELLFITIDKETFNLYLETTLSEGEWNLLKEIDWPAYINIESIFETIDTGIGIALGVIGLEYGLGL